MSFKKILGNAVNAIFPIAVAWFFVSGLAAGLLAIFEVPFFYGKFAIEIFPSSSIFDLAAAGARFGVCMLPLLLLGAFNHYIFNVWFDKKHDRLTTGDSMQMQSSTYQNLIVGKGDTVKNGKTHWNDFIHVRIEDQKQAFTLAMDILRQIEHQQNSINPTPVRFDLTGTLETVSDE